MVQWVVAIFLSNVLGGRPIATAPRSPATHYLREQLRYYRRGYAFKFENIRVGRIVVHRLYIDDVVLWDAYMAGEDDGFEAGMRVLAKRDATGRSHDATGGGGGFPADPAAIPWFKSTFTLKNVFDYLSDVQWVMERKRAKENLRKSP